MYPGLQLSNLYSKNVYRVLQLIKLYFRNVFCVLQCTSKYMIKVLKVTPCSNDLLIRIMARGCKLTCKSTFKLRMFKVPPRVITPMSHLKIMRLSFGGVSSCKGQNFGVALKQDVLTFWMTQLPDTVNFWLIHGAKFQSQASPEMNHFNSEAV